MEAPMRRLAWILSAALLVAVLPAPVAAAGRCTIEVTPAQGTGTDLYRISGSNFPVDAAGGSIEVRIDVRRLGTREGSIIFAFLVPGATEFYVDYNEPLPEEPAPDPLPAGRYLVIAQTPHLPGCTAVDQFVVVA
jgi:hypothetical protein